MIRNKSHALATKEYAELIYSHATYRRLAIVVQALYIAAVRTSGYLKLEAG